MFKQVTAVAFATLIMSTQAFAMHCPRDMAQIDAALAAGTTLEEAVLAQVRTLRAEGEALHSSGDHAGSVEVLAEAKALLGIE